MRRPVHPGGGGRGRTGRDPGRRHVQADRRAETQAEPAKSPFADDDEDAESVKRGYGVVAETAAEVEQAKKNKPNFGEIEDKFKRSARGPAVALLIKPTNLLIIEGILTGSVGVIAFVVGLWPFIFSDGIPDDDEIDDGIIWMIVGLSGFLWGSLMCLGASKMNDLSSYSLGMISAIMSIVEGIFLILLNVSADFSVILQFGGVKIWIWNLLGVEALITGYIAINALTSPIVRAGFEEGEGGPEDDDLDDVKQKNQDDDEDDDDEDEEDEDEERPKKRRTRARRSSDD